jgi:hypothetical protein
VGFDVPKVIKRVTKSDLVGLSENVLPQDFKDLPDLSEERLVQLARWALSHVPISPLPAEDLAEWARARGAIDA